ncbi:hypothetical protein M9H77_21635 [Catharanthus roseus]|uniref:Uncharacterized protein n=1 Tax=Catharanthus roseus TaxID=4058 RepID=A0ACC0AQQ1_CATRO|nr:hypothetical protein M9H77_21635 [Catharanthus roseus]
MIAEMTGKTLQKKMFFRFFTRLAAMILLVCLEVTVSGAITLSNREVEALKKIGSVLGKTDWNFSVDPCSGEKGFDNSVSCDCSFANNTLCHVIGIALKGQNLSGSLPPELIRLPYLQELDLSRNYLNGSIPPEWGSTKLKLISLLGNRISGPIPIELGNITTLTNLTLSSNLLEGTLPPELGNLLHIEKLDFASNNLTGVLPSTLANLTKLKDFRVGDNQFSGSIPNFIQKWTHLEKLFIQGSGLDGPIPSAIASLTELTDLRISDVKGNFSSFPPLSSAKNMNTLILRSCNIDGPFPLYLGLMKNLEVLDLSFNSISGPVPSSFVASPDIHFIYLTSNFLTGAVPHWMVDSKANIDLSYNDFTPGSSKASTLQKPNLNMFNSEGNQMSTHSCSQNSRRPQYWYSLHINCGGKEHEVGGKHFENDTEVGGSANFFQSSTNWAVSSTGHFLDDTRTDSYTVTNSSRISGNSPELYMNARLSPLSLTYYGFCLLNGNYTVNLHFAEIMFTEDRTYSSLGRRIFDIYIQGKLMLEEFNIEDEAGGVNKPIIKRFPVKVIDNTLNIRFYWAGKGTMDMPVRGVYGPLISAISVDPDFTPPEHRDALSAGAKIGIVIAVLLIVCFLRVILRLICSLCDTLGRAFWALQLLWIRIIIQKTSFKLVDSRIFNVQTFSFTLEQIKAATNNFDVANKIGEGGFGCVYKGNLLNGQKVAVKQLSSQSEQGSREFVAEIGIISGLQHPNLVKLYGCCIEANQLILVYEYMENNSLAHALFGPEEHQLKLDWPARYNICVGTARALAFLHEESILKIVHRDIKSTNVLLDKNLEPKISDFGLAKLYEEVNAHTRTRIVGTL